MSQHFISGLPRSGSTLLAAILRQNPSISASITSPAGTIVANMQKAISGANEAAMFLTEDQKTQLLRHCITDCCDEGKPVMIDTNRGWTAKLPLLAMLFPECKVICCVRDISWIIDSIERIHHKNPLELSGLFGFDASKTVYERAQSLISAAGLIGFAMNALREGYYGAYADRLLLIEYDALTKHPKEVLQSVYGWLALPAYEHDFEAIEPIPLIAEFDAKLGMPGLHHVHPKVEWKPRQTILPPDIVTSLEKTPPFWRTSKSTAKVLRCK